MKKERLTKKELAIEKALLRGEYLPAGESEVRSIARTIAARKKDAVLYIRVNSEDLSHIKQKARHMGVPYQTFISEIIHRYAG